MVLTQPRLEIREKFLNSQQKDRLFSTAIVFIIGSGIFCFHASTIFRRYMDNEVNESVLGKRNTSLILPTVQMQFETTRDGINGVPDAAKILKQMSFRGSLDSSDLPEWAINILHDKYDGVHSITMNRIKIPVLIIT